MNSIASKTHFNAEAKPSELIVAAQEVGIPHPPGYPLLAILLKLWNYFVPNSLIAFSSALLNSLIAALCNTAFYSLIEKATRPSVALLGTTLFGFSDSVWEWTSNLEVFTLNNLLCICLLIQLTSYLNDSSVKNLKTGVFISGLCLTNQHTSVLYILPIGLICAIKERKNLTLKFIGSLILYAAIPLRKVLVFVSGEVCDA